MFWLAVPVCALASSIAWILVPLRAVQHDRQLGKLCEGTAPQPDSWPMVSILVPARDEIDSLESAVTSLLAIDYPNLEIVLIDDRSTDGTAELVDALASRDNRIRPLHIDSLPTGWLGKVHALHRGLEVCRGEWLLFTDADIHFAPRTLRLAIAHCLAGRKDFLSLLPRLRDSDPLVGAAQSAMGTLLLALMDSEQVADPDSPQAMGVGAFNLARRACLDPDQGLEWLRMEVADDAGLALLMKSRGAHTELLSGLELIEVDWYPSLAGMFDGVMQRMFLGAGYSPWIYLLQCTLSIGCLLSPLLLATLLAPASSLAWLCLGLYALPSLILGTGLRNFPIPARLLWLWPVGAVLVGYGMIRSLVTVARRGGIYWRGSVYPLNELRAGQRVRPENFVPRRRPRSGIS